MRSPHNLFVLLEVRTYFFEIFENCPSAPVAGRKTFLSRSWMLFRFLSDVMSVLPGGETAGLAGRG
ncbi:hypothetical protein Y981_10185 [Leptospirillum ferriphilum YSK]|uniref:Uncharacterized protein n=1 Tax=Leptospirillum ferriphilum YSK TaxID=1441628 RepID=A0A059XXS3_9BACT|nr:hypothetical protein Y981_10185 [Leptospirillum ferriphilum YSK]